MLCVSFVFADGLNEPITNGKPFLQIWDAIYALRLDLQNILTKVDNISINPGPKGNDGYSCWDINMNYNYNCDPLEDINGDGKKGSSGLPGEAGQNGSDGINGTNGINCWDLNGDGIKNLSTEDINGDVFVDVKDCRGEQGDKGLPGDNSDYKAGFFEFQQSGISHPNSVTFATPYPDSNYSILMTTQYTNGDLAVATFTEKTPSGFKVVLLNQDNNPLSGGFVSWMTVPFKND